MLIDLLVNGLLTVVGAFLGLIPSFTLPDLGDFGASFGSSARVLNGYFPVNMLAVCLAAIVGVRVWLLGAQLVIFVYGLIPFKAT